MWAYHVTLKEFLPSIARRGLLPSEHRSVEEPAIFVEGDSEEAGLYMESGKTSMLRFDVAGWDTTEDGEYVIYDRIPPEDIWIRKAGRWKPLLETVTK